MPDGERIYAIGDVHGHLASLDKVEAKILADLGARPAPTRTSVIFLGDYIDRGASSREVIQRLCSRSFAGLPARFLIGNHEDAMLHFLSSPRDGADWLSFGGTATLASYGIFTGAALTTSKLPEIARKLQQALPAEHMEFLRSLELFIEAEGFLFVHAGIRPAVPLAKQTRRDLLTIREPFLSHCGETQWRVVHGHTIVAEPIISQNRVSLDIGAYATGNLACAAIEGGEVLIL
ncbi:metallophosphoesterase [Sphingomonas sp.]|uniref:metallophosphoesterase n=1 Tax=Sphingomonas sp. TaxID=28214 RepID=UPI003B3ADFFA